jgi:hypothetical protein
LYTLIEKAMIEQLAQCTGFDWDEGNREKNWIRHRVSMAECEQVFLNLPFVVAPDETHSDVEPRYYVLGRTDAGRRLFVVATIRGTSIRVTSARDMSRRERKEYNNAEERIQGDSKV